MSATLCNPADGPLDQSVSFEAHSIMDGAARMSGAGQIQYAMDHGAWEGRVRPPIIGSSEAFLDDVERMNGKVEAMITGVCQAVQKESG
jgi:hypothetical protein